MPCGVKIQHVNMLQHIRSAPYAPLLIMQAALGLGSVYNWSTISNTLVELAALAKEVSQSSMLPIMDIRNELNCINTYTKIQTAIWAVYPTRLRL